MGVHVMKFDYCVKHDGVYYEAGTEVPVSDKSVKENTTETKKTEKTTKKKEVE